tara:strand:- start:474 stop:581 length:108 start_codon:yes stop_codon:yes gene_type:complete
MARATQGQKIMTRKYARIVGEKELNTRIRRKEEKN